MGIMIWMTEIYGIIQLFFWIIFYFDEDHRIVIENKTILMEAGLSIIGGILIALQKLDFLPSLLLGVFLAYLIVAAISDRQTQTVHDFLHVMAAMAGVILICCQQPGSAVIIDYFIFLLIQMILFRKMYGEADVYVFLVCALYQAAGGRTMLHYTLHMGTTFLLLTMVQLLKRNINKRGNLKNPVALVPYIAATAWLFL